MWRTGGGRRAGGGGNVPILEGGGGTCLSTEGGGLAAGIREGVGVLAGGGGTKCRWGGGGLGAAAAMQGAAVPDRYAARRLSRLSRRASITPRRRRPDARKGPARLMVRSTAEC